MAKSTNKNTKRFFLRTGLNTSDPMSADVEILGVKGRMTVAHNGDCKVFKLLASGKPSAKPMAQGKFFKHPFAGTGKQPDVRADVVTAKETKIAFVGWAHSPDANPYYVIQVDDFVRKGKFHTFK